MKKLLFLFCFLGNLSFAQVLPYTFTVDQEPYAALSNPTPFPVVDYYDVQSLLLSFEIELFGETSQVISLFEDGITGIGDIEYGPFKAAYPYISLFMPFENGPMNSELNYQIDDDNGDRILKIEWKNYGFYDDQVGTSFVNFQVWFYELSGRIEYRYGLNAVDLTQDLFEGRSGPTIGLAESFQIYTANFWYLKGDPTNPDLVFVDETDFDDLTEVLDASPRDSTVYIFDPITISVVETMLDNWSISPSLAKTDIKVEMPSFDAYRVDLTDQNGRIAKSLSFEGTEISIPVSELPEGFYILQARSADQKWSPRKVIVQR